MFRLLCFVPLFFSFETFSSFAEDLKKTVGRCTIYKVCDLQNFPLRRIGSEDALKAYESYTPSPGSKKVINGMVEVAEKVDESRDLVSVAALSSLRTQCRDGIDELKSAGQYILDSKNTGNTIFQADVMKRSSKGTVSSAVKNAYAQTLLSRYAVESEQGLIGPNYERDWRCVKEKFLPDGVINHLSAFFFEKKDGIVEAISQNEDREQKALDETLSTVPGNDEEDGNENLQARLSALRQ